MCVCVCVCVCTVLQEMFSYAGPKFLYPGHPNYAEVTANPANSSKEMTLMLNQQWTVFKVPLSY